MTITTKKDFEVTVYITQRRAHATDILLKNKGVYDNVVCCGGDGTLNEVITGLMGMEKDQRPIIGYIPVVQQMTLPQAWA